jgi:hypothetical protein
MNKRKSLALVLAVAAACAASVAVAETAKTIDGHPDLSGVWGNDEMGFVNPQRDEKGSVLCIVGCPRAATPPAAAATEGKPAPAAAAAPPRRAPSKPKYKPEFQAKVDDLNTRQTETDLTLRCGNPGLPRIGPPEVIVQTPGQVVFLYEDLSGSFWRVIPTDGREHRADAEESYLGDAVGKWNGDTLVIESTKFIDTTWLTDNGAFHTADLRVVEELKLVDGKLEYQATAHDPAVLAEPWQLRTRNLVRSAKPINEPIPCVESDMDHIVDGTHHDNPR